MVADTIFALASPPGRSGVAVLRISGPRAREVVLSMAGRDELPVRSAVLSGLYSHEKSPSGRVLIDRALVLYFAAPASFTGEDVVELHPHGSPAVLRELQASLTLYDGVRMAEPGEFTRRAFENGKMDLTAAEAVADLINAETQLQKAQALAQMGGALSGLYGGWTERLKRALAYIEADLEFPDEDMPDGVLPDLLPEIKVLADEMSAHLDDNNRGERLRDGIQVAVIGAPNAGKSSLVNALAQRDVAIVSELAGTTRDVIEVHLDLGGYPVILADTAGLRPDQIGADGQDAIEGEGIKRALARAEAADIKLLMFDAGEAEPDAHTLALLDDASLVVVNKIDESNRLVLGGDGLEPVLISANIGKGLDDLIVALVQKVEDLIGAREAPSLTRQRHRTALSEGLSCLQRAQGDQLPELVAEDLRLAVRAIGRVTGRVDVEDLLDVIFRDFCIGK